VDRPDEKDREACERPDPRQDESGHPPGLEEIAAVLVGHRVAEELALEGLAGDQVEFVRQIDMRYVGQSFELTMPGGRCVPVAGVSSMVCS